jgi:hypothetical protein
MMRDYPNEVRILARYRVHRPWCRSDSIIKEQVAGLTE